VCSVLVNVVCECVVCELMAISSRCVECVVVVECVVCLVCRW
jgi:hypothetical protein